jgi:hypothetical protein
MLIRHRVIQLMAALLLLLGLLVGPAGVAPASAADGARPIPWSEQNPDDFIIKEFTSAQGNKYAVAYPKSAGSKDEDRAASVGSGDSWIDVKWPDGFSSSSSPLPQAVIDIGISDASVWEYNLVWKYEVGFTNTKGWGFQFKDATNDVYKVSTVVNGWHYLLYNSSDPTIIGVQ